MLKAPRTDPGGRDSRTGLPPWVFGGEAYARPGMENAGLWQPVIGDLCDPVPASAVLLMTLRKVIKTRGSFPNEEAALKLLYLGLMNVCKKWSFVQGWREALNRFQILWPDRMPALER